MAKILVTTRMQPQIRERLSAAGHVLVLCDAVSWEEKCAAAKDCEAVACRGGAYPAAFFEALPKLRILALPSAGYDQVDLESARAHHVIVTNAGSGNARSVAEMACLLMLGAAKKMTYNTAVVSAGGPWRNPKQPTFSEVSGKTIALLGYGNIAREMDHLCRGFDMKVIAYHPRISQKTLPEGTIPCDDLALAVKDADIVSCHIPARPENVHFLDASFFASMKPGALFINTGRGSVVDEAALIDALRCGHLGGAGLDVFEEEPTPATNPLLHMDNVVCMPHIGGETREAKERVYGIAAENVLRVLSGEAPLSPVT